MRRYELSDESWELIRDLFPIPTGKGRPCCDHRMMINAMLWILNTGSPGRDLPERYGPWQTAYNRFNRWQRDGTFDVMLERLQVRLDTEGRIDWDLWCVDGSSIRTLVPQHHRSTNSSRRVQERRPTDRGDHGLRRSSQQRSPNIQMDREGRPR